MKRAEVIERLKKGAEIILDKSVWFGGAHFRGGFETVRYDTAQNLIDDGLVTVTKSESAHNIYYLKWKGNEINAKNGK